MNQKRLAITRNIERKLWGHSLGICANPECMRSLFLEDAVTIGEIAHIEPYCISKNNDFSNLIILCPNCHTSADKTRSQNELKEWKQIQEAAIKQLSTHEYANFEDLAKEVKPILEHNKLIYENYYLGQETSTLWEKSEPTILANNMRLRLLFKNNLQLFQRYGNDIYSNDKSVLKFIQHAEEFENTREDVEKLRCILFPQEINSIFEIEPIRGAGIASNFSTLQNFIKHLKENSIIDKLDIISDKPFLQYYSENQELQTLYLDDFPNVQQKYWNSYAYSNQNSTLRLKNVIFFLRWLHKRDFEPIFPDEIDLSVVMIKEGYTIKMVYEYCLSEADIQKLSPQQGLLIVNLHDFNGESCVSKDAYKLGKAMEVKIFTTNDFYKFCHNELSK